MNPEITLHPALLWVTAITGVLILIVSSMEKLETRWKQWMDKRRRAKFDAEDARVGDQLVEINYLKEAIKTTRADQQVDREYAQAKFDELRDMMTKKESINTALTTHAWDWRRRHAAAGFPYPAPVTPVTPEGIGDLIPRWRGDELNEEKEGGINGPL